MIELAELIGEGVERRVYLHPDNAGVVVKVLKIDDKPDRNEIEEWYLNKVRHVDTPFFPKIIGWEDTIHGKGLMFERIFDFNGEPSQPIAFHIANNNISLQKALRTCLDVLSWAEKQAVLVYDLNPNNLLVRRTDPDGNFEIVLVDGFGPKRLNWRTKLRVRIPTLARVRIRWIRKREIRTWDRLYKRNGSLDQPHAARSVAVTSGNDAAKARFFEAAKARFFGEAAP
ncbi:YrbL family protein [Chelativorans sp. YIM 93263]|uniref:YrbL family protein n=1 Tax=Chelativorans sp. YIM 93263 TaxID=2906648 RepID=UPI002377E843|nr:YrbL family protein [Chelativorans sp. YIM 93263]